RGVEVEVGLLDVLAVVALASGQAEQALLEDRVAPVPQRQREAQPAVIVGDSGDAVLAPAVRARARVIVRKGVPGRAAGAVVLPDGAPLPLGEIRAPPPPVSRPLPSFLESQLFACQRTPHPNLFRTSIRCSQNAPTA